MKISIFPLTVPFKSKFSHASYERTYTESFFVKVTHGDDVGFGESCPRRYVTGETIESCNLFTTKYSDDIAQIKCINDLITWVNVNSALINSNPAAWCAIEIAIIDLFAKRAKLPASQILALEQRTRKQVFSAIVGQNSLKKTLLFRLMGFSDFKLKIGSSACLNWWAIKLTRLLGIPAKKIRLDANNLWSTPEECIDSLLPLKGSFWALEEPINAFDYEGMYKIANALSCKIILDESFLAATDILKFKHYKDSFIVNIRIAKLGGVLRAIETIKQLNVLNIPFILGSHVGETSLLGKVQQVVFQSCEHSPMAVEGGFSSWLLTRDPFQPQLKVGYGGKYPLADLKEAPLGWGVNYEK